MPQPHYSRSRFRSDGRWRLNNQIVRTHYDSNGPITTIQHPYSIYIQTKSEYMDDCINPYSSRGFRAPGPCSSYKVRRDGDLSSKWSETVAADPGIWDDYFNPVDPNHYDLAQVVGYLPTVPASMIQDNRIAAWSKMITQVPTDVSVANFALELLDFKESFAHYAKAVIPRKYLKKGLRMQDLPGWANSTFLDANFNLLPFVQDLLKMTQVFSRVAKRIDFLRKTRGKPVRQAFFNPNLWDENPHVGETIHSHVNTGPYKADWETTGFPYENYMGNLGGSRIGGTDLMVVDFRATFSASWSLLQELEGLDDAWAQLRGLIAGLGLNNPAKIVWNAIPFSFVLDWMAPFGKTLDGLAVQPFYGRWDIYDVVNSVKETWKVRQGRYYYGDLEGIQPFYNDIIVERYNRRLGLDLSLEDVDFTDLSKQQQSLFASLIAGNTLFRSGRKQRAS